MLKRLILTTVTLAMAHPAIAACPTPFTDAPCARGPSEADVCSVDGLIDANVFCSFAGEDAGIKILGRSPGGDSDSLEFWGTAPSMEDDFCCVFPDMVEGGTITIYGSGYNDIIDMAPLEAGTVTGHDTFLYPGDGADNTRGSPDADHVDTVEDAQGADTIQLFEGDDVAFGGPDGDVIFGNEGADTLDGGSGDDVIDGGPGPDTIDGQSGPDKIKGGGGNDTLYGKLTSGCTYCPMEGDADMLCGDPGNDTMYGHGGADILFGGAGDDHADGGADTDTCDAESEVDCEPGDVEECPF